MDNIEFSRARNKLSKSQKQMAGLLGTSLKAIQSYEQGWRSIPTHVERQVFFLVSRMRENSKNERPCWVIKKCLPERKKQCPAWEFQSGRLCWFINGTMCEGKIQRDWRKKMRICRSCEVIAGLL